MPRYQKQQKAERLNISVKTQLQNADLLEDAMQVPVTLPEGLCSRCSGTLGDLGRRAGGPEGMQCMMHDA